MASLFVTLHQKFTDVLGFVVPGFDGESSLLLLKILLTAYCTQNRYNMYKYFHSSWAGNALGYRDPRPWVLTLNARVYKCSLDQPKRS